MKKNAAFLLFVFILTPLYSLFGVQSPSSSLAGYRITVQVDNYTENEMMLAYYLLDKQYIITDSVAKSDTVTRQADGSFIFQGDKPLEPGMYLLVFLPDNNFTQILINENDQFLNISLDYSNITESIRFSGGSGDNAIFYAYRNFLDQKRAEYGPTDQNDPESITDAQKAINKEVEDYQKRLIGRNPNSLTAAIVRANLGIDIPEYQGTEEEVKTLKWQYFKKHYFDNINLADPRMYRSSFLFERVTYYVDKLTSQHPDSIAHSIDFILKMMEPAEETYKGYVIHFLNKYASSPIVGMDAVYVHMVETYYASGKAPWTESSQLEKIIENADVLKPTLIGMQAPAIGLKARNGIQFNLYDIESDFTLLLFWKSNSHSGKLEFQNTLAEDYQKLNALGVELIAICMDQKDEISQCWDYVENEGLDQWMHVTVLESSYGVVGKYDLRAIPQIYLLDRNKTIVFKKVGMEQMVKVITSLSR